MIFWIVASLLTLITSALFAVALIRRVDEEAHPATFDLQVYRDQLKEVDRDLARGVIAPEDGDRIRTEISRRILAADAQMQDPSTRDGGRGPATIALAAVLAVVVIGVTFVGYTFLGAPGYRDQPLQVRFEIIQENMGSRISQAEMEAQFGTLTGAEPAPEYAALMDQLRNAVAENPDDLQGQILLARNEASLGNLKAAYEAQAKVIALKGDELTAGDYVLHANLLISAGQDYVSPEAEASLRAALDIDPLNNLGRYYWGMMLWQNGRPDATFRVWDQVLKQSPADAPWVPAIRARITDLAWFAGVKYELPAAVPAHGDGLSGPSSADVDAAGEMSADDRAEMIQGMVSQLSERLATEGGTPQEWARLIGAYGVLGEIEKAEVIWGEAQQVFAASPEALEIVRSGAAKAGVAK